MRGDVVRERVQHQHRVAYGDRQRTPGTTLADDGGDQWHFQLGHDVQVVADGGGPDIPGVVVPEGKVLVLGDHRGDSLDGRYFGFVDADAIYGRAVAVYWRRGEGLGLVVRA